MYIAFRAITVDYGNKSWKYCIQMFCRS